MNYLVVTIKSWNKEQFRALKARKKQHRWFLISDPKKLTYERVKEINPRYIFVPHWSWIIPSKIWQEFETVIFHDSPLPYGRGGSPVQNMIWSGHKTTKLTALRAVSDLDAGPIYMQISHSLTGSIDDILKRASRIIFHQMIPEITRTNPKPKPQKGRVVIFKRRRGEDNHITDELSLPKLYDLIRMLDGEGYPRARLRTGKFVFEFSKAKLGKRELVCEVRVQEEQE